MHIYQRIKDFGKKVLLVSGLVTVVNGCNDCQKGIGQIVNDFNNDGKSDIVNVSYDGAAEPRTKGYTVSFDSYISLGQEDGTFTPQKKAFHFELKPENLQVGDVNGDGNKDLLFIAYDSDAEPRTKGYVASFDQYAALGNGDGTFQNPKKILHYNTKPDY